MPWPETKKKVARFAVTREVHTVVQKRLAWVRYRTTEFLHHRCPWAGKDKLWTQYASASSWNAMLSTIAVPGPYTGNRKLTGQSWGSAQIRHLYRKLQQKTAAVTPRGLSSMKVLRLCTLLRHLRQTYVPLSVLQVTAQICVTLHRILMT